MKEKQHNKKAGKGGKGKFAVFAGAIIALVAVVVTIVCFAGEKTEQEPPRWKIKTHYVDLHLPLEMEGIITSEESTYGTVYTYAFYMNYNGQEIPLWRVDFGDANSVDWIGRLVTDAGDIPVAMTGFVASNEDLTALGEEGAQLYGDCMQGYIVMLEGLMADPRFTTERPVVVGENTEMKLMYWSVTLPSKMTVQENNRNGNYEAVFSGEVVGEMVLLYRICIGEQQTGSLIGYFEIDGQKKPVSAESYALTERESWNTDDYETAYRMMATINDVIQQIMSSKNYSEFGEG